jgi:cellulose biosynthesis protein BcsQ
LLSIGDSASSWLTRTPSATPLSSFFLTILRKTSTDQSEPRTHPNGFILSGTSLQPIIAGDASIEKQFTTATPGSNRFGVSLLPGHPQIALLEDKLSQTWTTYVGGDLGGARVSNWNTQLLALLRSRYDLIVFDVGPSLGALNRSVLVGVDYFIAPMGCDIFSLIGIENIGDWLERWQRVYDQGYRQCVANHEDALAGYDIKTESAHMSRFLGFTVQQYITKTIREQRRATSAYETILQEIPTKIEHSLRRSTAPALLPTDLRLSDVPHMYSLVPLAQTAHAPIHGLTSSDGLSGGQYGQLEDYQKFIASLSSSVIRNLEKASGQDNAQLA